MENITTRIEGQIKRLNNRLPDYLSHKVTDIDLLKSEIKRHKRKAVADRTRNLFIVMFLLAITALFIGSESYYYMGGIGFFAALYLASPTAKSARVVSFAQQKIFLLQLLHELKKEEHSPELPKGGADLLVGYD